MLWYWLARNRAQSTIIGNAHVHEASTTHLVVGTKSINWLGLGLSAAFTLLFVALGAALMVNAESDSDFGMGLFFIVVFGLLGLVLVIASVGQQTLHADAAARTLTLSRRNPLLGGLGTKTTAYDTAHVAIQHNGSEWLRNHSVTVQTMDGSLINLRFGNRSEEAARVAGFLQQAFIGANAAARPDVTLSQAVVDRAAMLRELRSWAIWLIIMGGLSVALGLAAGVVSAPWGLMLIGVGLASFLIREPAMFVVYAVTVGWAAVSNLLSGQGQWIGASVIQVVIAFRQIQNYRRFRQSETRLAGEANAPASEATGDRAAQLFPWAAVVSGALALIGFAVVIVSALLVGAYQIEGVQGLLAWMEEGAIVAAVLGIATGLASLTSGFRYKIAAIAGLVLGALTVLVELALLLVL